MTQYMNIPRLEPAALAVEVLPYQSLRQTDDLRWVVRMLALVMVAHALTSLGGVASNLLLMGMVPLWRLMLGLQLPAGIAFLAAAVLLLVRRGTITGVIVAYSLRTFVLLISLGLQFRNVFLLRASGGSSAPIYQANLASGSLSLVAGVLEAVAIILILLRCRKSGALV